VRTGFDGSLFSSSAQRRPPGYYHTRRPGRVIQIAFDVETEAASLEVLMERYSDVPMSLADACLVRLSELHSDCRVLTVDSHFTRYRRHGRQVIPLLMP
jgi:predicted nucleic acid-binding protein